MTSAYIESYGTTKLDDCITWTQKYSNSTYTNFTSVTYPNQTKVIFNPQIESNKIGSEYYYDACNWSSIVGEYEVCGTTDVDGVDTDFCVGYEVNLSGSERNITVLIADILIILFLLIIIIALHRAYGKYNREEANKSIINSHDGNWGKTFIKTMANNLMKNSFLWYYSIGWLILIVMKDLILNFSSSEIYGFFVLFLDIYSFGFFLIIVVWIGILIKHFQFITEIIQDINMGVSE